MNVLEARGIRSCYFGHIHGSEAAKRAVIGEFHGIKMHLISCDYVNFLPVLVNIVTDSGQRSSTTPPAFKVQS